MNTHRLCPPTNQVLASLPPDAADALRSHVEAVDLPTLAMLQEAGSPLQHVYFPVTAVVSLFSPLRDGSCTEVAVVGREGIVGVCAFMGGATNLTSAVVQSPGLAWRMGARAIADLAQEFGPVMQPLLRYTGALLTHMAQNAVCHRHHALAPQLCSWLLQHLDRQAGDDMRITQERIAGMLGVRREGVTSAALQLQRDGLIHYTRGHITVLDRQRLEQHSCECYGVVERAYQQLRRCTPSSAGSAGASDHFWSSEACPQPVREYA